MADIFEPDDGTSPLGQGDLVWVAQAKLLTEGELPREAAAANAPPPLGTPAGTRSLLWQTTSPEEEVWVNGVNTIGMVLTPDCAIDKDMHRLAEHLITKEGLGEDEAYARAEDDAEFLTMIAEIRTVADLPVHQQGQAGRLGLLKLDTFPGAPVGTGPFVVDFSRVTTVSNRLIERRLARSTALMKHKLQAALCQHLAARNVELTVALTQLFVRPVVRVESLVAPEPEKQKLTMRVRVHFDDGKSAVVEAKLTQDDLVAPAAPLVQRKALHRGTDSA